MAAYIEDLPIPAQGLPTHNPHCPPASQRFDWIGRGYLETRETDRGLDPDGDDITERTLRIVGLDELSEDEARELAEAILRRVGAG